MRCNECENKKNFTPPVIEINNPPEVSVFHKVVVPISMGGPDEVPPTIGKYKNVLLYYEKTEDAYLYSSDGIPTLITGDLSDILSRLDTLEDGLAEETENREDADNNLQNQIEAIKAASDVVDIVGTYQELMNYDTSTLGENDIIRVLVDETHDGATSYYRWTDGEWEFIGALGPFYTQDELDQMFTDEADAREAADSALSSSIDSLSSSLSAETTARQQADTNLQGSIDAEASARQTADANLHAEVVAEANARSQADAEIEQAWQTEATTRGTADQALQTAIDNEISARATAVSALSERVTTAESNIAAETDARTAADTALQMAINNKQNQLTAGTGIDITNDVISVTEAGPTVVQTTGTSTTDVMSQNAVTSMVYADKASSKIAIDGTCNASGPAVSIGDGSVAGYICTAIGYGAKAMTGQRAVALGSGALATANRSVALGGATADAENSVAVGASAYAHIVGQFDIGAGGVYGTDTRGYNNSAYRLLTGLYDPQSDHDAATKGYVDTAAASAGTAFTNAEFNSIFDTSLTEGA